MLEIERSIPKKAALYFLGQAEFKNLTTRWVDNVSPNIFVTVEVGTEDDVASTDIIIVPNSKTAALGGGAYNDNVVNALHAKGKLSARCVGLMGAGLGGGYGRYEGFYGLVLDNVIDMNVILADGSKDFVAATSSLGLYWAMRGAGHNFGTITNIDLQDTRRDLPDLVHNHYDL
ncbi:MAG: hypothetical protein Q9169_004716 [Polycauliona sp. 2 TL-2023]